MSHVNDQTNPAGAIPVYIAPGPSSATITDISGTITAGGADQVMDAARVSRRGAWIQNQSTGDLWVNELGSAATAAPPCIRIGAGQLYEFPQGGISALAISIIGATTGQAWAGRVW